MEEVMTMNWSSLIYLICPLMMLPMIIMMLKGNQVHDEEKQHAAVKEELSQLKKQNENMQKQLETFKSVSR
jgi:uncharacterized membrane-anchored protein YhcB (DUF1043 family)